MPPPILLLILLILADLLFALVGFGIIPTPQPQPFPGQVGRVNLVIVAFFLWVLVILLGMHL
jgi:hypothetical protein